MTENELCYAVQNNYPVTQLQGRVFKDSYPKNTQWKRFVAQAGLPVGFRFHDIRHTFATWLSQSGVERKTVQELAGWNSSSMLDNYVHLPSSHLAAASEGLSQLFTAQIRHNEHIRQLEKVAFPIDINGAG